MIEDERGLITGHFLAHWGVPKMIHPKNILGFKELAILEFSPKRERTTWRYATNGMSSFVQSYPNESIKVRTEIYVCTRKEAPWICDLLAAIVTYPMEYKTYLSDGDTIDVGKSIDRMHSPYSGILFTSPGPEDPFTLGLVGGLEDKILVHQVIGLLPNEVNYSKTHTSNSLKHSLDLGFQVFLDENRSSNIWRNGLDGLLDDEQ